MTYAKPVPTFADIETEFMERVRTLVGCTAAAVDARGKPRSRVWHPIWEGNTGRIATNRNTLKTRHLARNPHLSLSYLDHKDPWRPVYVDCRAPSGTTRWRANAGHGRCTCGRRSR
jgi:hypothetical protein